MINPSHHLGFLNNPINPSLLWNSSFSSSLTLEILSSPSDKAPGDLTEPADRGGISGGDDLMVMDDDGVLRLLV